MKQKKEKHTQVNFVIVSTMKQQQQQKQILRMRNFFFNFDFENYMGRHRCCHIIIIIMMIFDLMVGRLKMIIMVNKRNRNKKHSH